MAKKNGDEVFDTNSFIKVDQYTKEYDDLNTRIEALEKKFGSNEQIADTLCETADKAARMQELLATSFTKLIRQNTDVQTAFTDFMNRADRNATRMWIKKIGTGVGAIVLAGLSGAVGWFIRGAR